MNSIPLHPQHGLNPSIPVCMYCGKELNMIALLGAKCKTEAPRNCFISDEPCDECKEKFKQGILLTEVNNEGIVQDYCVITFEAAERMFEGFPDKDKVFKMGRCNCEKGFIQQIIKQGE